MAVRETVDGAYDSEVVRASPTTSHQQPNVRETRIVAPLWVKMLKFLTNEEKSWNLRTNKRYQEAFIKKPGWVRKVPRIR